MAFRLDYFAKESTVTDHVYKESLEQKIEEATKN
jgi:hypothetical protein